MQASYALLHLFFMKKYFSSIGIKSTNGSLFLLLQQTVWMAYGGYEPLLQEYLLFVKKFSYLLFYTQICFIYILFEMSLFTKPWKIFPPYILL